MAASAKIILALALYFGQGISCPDFQSGAPTSPSCSRKPLPTRGGRVGRGCRAITQPPAEAHTEAAKNSGPEHILSSIKFSKCELQPPLSRIPIRRAGSTDTPPTHPGKTSFTSISSLAPGEKDKSATKKVLRLLKPGLHRHLTLSGVSGKEAAIHLASKALKKKSSDRSFNCKGSPIIETTSEKEETLQQIEETPAMPPHDTVNMRETVTLCGEA